MRIQNRTISVVSTAVAVSSIAIAFMPADARFVALPGFACVLMVLWLWMTLWDRDKKIPFFDVGIFCALATLVYTAYPLVNYWVGGLQFGFLSDYRLRSYNVTPRELGFFHLRPVVYLASFVLLYSTFRGRGSIASGNVSATTRSTRQVIVMFFLLFTGYFFILQLTTGVNYNTSYELDVYAKSMAAFASIPLPLLQISGKFIGILFLFKVALLFIVVSRCEEKRWRIILFAWILLEILQVVYIKGARSGLVLFLMATALLYHRLIKPLSLKYIITSGTALFVLFIFLGFYRQYIEISSLQEDLSQGDGGIFSAGNEFQALLGTAYDVYHIKEAGADLPWYLYINDIINIFPPRQFLPFEKIDASEWYLREIGISGTGQGFMWGVISQSIVGLDWLELALRGAILGYILAKFHRWYLKHQSGFLATLLYMFFCLKAYYTFRETTLSLLSNLVLEVIPFFILLRLGVALLSRKVGDQPGHLIAITSPNRS
jgi:hypothetical protein